MKSDSDPSVVIADHRSSELWSFCVTFVVWLLFARQLLRFRSPQNCSSLESEAYEGACMELTTSKVWSSSTTVDEEEDEGETLALLHN